MGGGSKIEESGKDEMGKWGNGEMGKWGNERTDNLGSYNEAERVACKACGNWGPWARKPRGASLKSHCSSLGPARNRASSSWSPAGEPIS